MNLLKNNLKLIILAMILIIVSSGIAVFATYNYFASDIKYTDDKTVADALNDLYDKTNNKKAEKHLINENPFNLVNTTVTFNIKDLTDDYSNLTINNFFYTADFYVSGNGLEKNVSLNLNYDHANGILSVSSDGLSKSGYYFAYYKNINLYYYY